MIHSGGFHDIPDSDIGTLQSAFCTHDSQCRKSLLLYLGKVLHAYSSGDPDHHTYAPKQTTNSF